MAAGQKDPKTVARKLAVARLMGLGLQSDQIAKRITEETGEKINAYQVSHIVTAVEKDWQESIRGEVGPWKAKCLMWYDHIVREALSGFELSKTGKKTARKVKGTRQVAVQGGGAGQVPSTVTLNSESETGTLQDRKAGDPKYLDTAKAAVDSIAKMLGINAPIKWAETDPDGQPKREVIEKEIFDALPKAKQAAFVEIMLEMKQIELRRMQEMGYMEDEDREPVIDVEGLLPDESGGNGEAGEDYVI